MSLASNQKGVALITALMIVALGTVISASIVTKLQIDIRRTANIISSDQARLYALAAEDLARRYLIDDLKDNKYDHLEEDWAQLYIFPLEDGTLQAQLTDMQACININALGKSGEIFNTTRQRIEQLFLNAKLSGGLINAVIDWIDADVETRGADGAEDAYYTTLDNPYRAANNNLHSISELKLIRGFEDQRIIDSISRDLCAFGDNGSTLPININTASREVILSLSNTMRADLADSIVEYRIDNPFKNINDFKNFEDVKTIIPDIKQLSTSTNYFMLETNIVIGDARVRMFSLLHRDSEVSIVSRSQGVF